MTPVSLPRWVRRACPALSACHVLGTRDGIAHVVAGETAAGPVVLKRYRPTDGAEAATRMRRVRRAVSADGATCLAVPAVLAFDAVSGVMTQALAPGRPLLPMLDGPDRRRGLRAAAEALAALHRSHARLGPATTPADHIADLIHPHPRVVGRALPALAPRLGAIVAALIVPPRHRRVPAVPIHRDAHARQMLLDGRRLWLIDWDLAAMGDAALDVANFRVYLRTHVARGDDAAARFLDAYARHDQTIGARLPPYEALTCLRLVCKAWRQRRPGWRRRLETLIGAAEDRL